MPFEVAVDDGEEPEARAGSNAMTAATLKGDAPADLDSEASSTSRRAACDQGWPEA